MHVSGSCHCGVIKIEAEAEEELAGICHCTDCQVLSGSAFRGGVQALRKTMTVAGKPKTYVKVAERGRRRLHAFCPDCATPLYADDPEAKTPFVSLRIGFLDQRDQLVPQVQTWRRSALPWSSRLAEIPALEKDDFASLAVSVRSE
ncbi:MAG TPA: GFA family protein [Phenylobacterium sp.]|jgi:hypothetical protein